VTGIQPKRYASKRQELIANVTQTTAIRFNYNRATHLNINPGFISYPSARYGAPGTRREAGILKARRAEMIQNRQRWGWVLVAAIAIGVALLCLLIPQGHSGNADWLAILPLLFVGIISPLSLLSSLAYEYVGRVPDAPALPALFQRPPPFQIA
jgi:hypothetical protein